MMKKKRWQIKKSHQSDPTYGVQISRESAVAASRQRKQKKDSQSDLFLGSEGGEHSPGEEVITRPKRQRKTKKRLSDPVRRIHEDDIEKEASVPRAQPPVQPQKILRRLPVSDGDSQAARYFTAVPVPHVKEKSKPILSKAKLKSKLYRAFSGNSDVILKSSNNNGILQAAGETKSSLSGGKTSVGVLKDSSEEEISRPEQPGEGLSAPAAKKNGKCIGTKGFPSGGEINVGIVKDSSEEEISRPEELQQFRKKKRAHATLDGKIADDPDKKEAQQTTLEERTPPSYSDLGKMACDDAGKIVYDIDNKQVQEAGEIKVLLDLDDATVNYQIRNYHDQLNCCLADDEEFWDEYDEPQLIEVYQRLALYRIKAHMANKGIELDTMQLKKQYPVSTLQDEGYFQRFECSLGWYFDPERCNIVGLEDYQRLMLNKDGLYQSWDYYQRTYSTYKSDEEYVQFWEEMVNKTKWIEDYIFKPQWEKFKRRAYHQYLGIATRFHNIFARVVTKGFNEYIWSLQYEFSCYKKLYALYLEIWKRVAKQKMDFADALREIYDGNMFPSCRRELKMEVENTYPMCNIMKYNYDTYVAGIDKELSEDNALPVVIKAVRKMTPQPMIYIDYARKKLSIAEAIGLVHRKNSNSKE